MGRGGTRPYRSRAGRALPPHIAHRRRPVRHPRPPQIMPAAQTEATRQKSDGHGHDGGRLQSGGHAQASGRIIAPVRIHQLFGHGREFYFGPNHQQLAHQFTARDPQFQRLAPELRAPVFRAIGRQLRAPGWNLLGHREPPGRINEEIRNAGMFPSPFMSSLFATGFINTY